MKKVKEKKFPRFCIAKPSYENVTSACKPPVTVDLATDGFYRVTGPPEHRTDVSKGD